MRRPASAPESASASPELNLQTCGWTKGGGTPVKGKGKPQSQETGQKHNWSEWKQLSREGQATFPN